MPADPGGTVGIVVEQRAPGSLYWDLYLFSAPGAEVGAILFATSGFSSFAFDGSIPNVSYADSAWLQDAFGDGRAVLFVSAFPAQSLGGTDDLGGLLLGTFTSALPTFDSVAISGDPAEIGSPAFRPNGDPYPPEQVILSLVPEGNTGLAAGVALLALALLRRSRPAQHLAG